jgi:hypothetical protein
MTENGVGVISYQFDRDAVWERVRGRKTVFLDTNIWIDMAGGKKPEVQAIKEKLTAMVTAGQIVCPLSAPLIWELYKQDFSKARTGALMEALSLNVCLTPTREMFDWEIEQFARRLAGQNDAECSPKVLFVPVASYLSSYFELTCPVESTESERRELGNALKSQLESLTLTELINLRSDDMSRFLKARPATPYQRNAQDLQAFSRGDRDKVWRIEEKTVFNSIIYPSLMKLSPQFRPVIHQFVQDAPRDKHQGCLPTLLSQLPALHNHVEVMALASQDPNRKEKSSDFFDIELLPVPLAYADVFVSQDRWIRDTLRNRSALLTRNKCVFCSRYDELAYLLTKELNGTF